MAEDSGLDQRRVGDRARHRVGIDVVGGAEDVHGHELGRALAVCGDLTRELAADGLDARGDRREGGRVDVDPLAGGSRFAGSQKDRGVVRGGVGVDRHLVEGLLDRGKKRLVGGGLGKRGVGGHHAEHGRHVRLDHAGALDEAAQVNGVLAAVRSGHAAFEGGLLGHGVGGHHGTGGVVGRLGAVGERGVRGRHAVLERREVELGADDAGRGDEHVGGLAAEHVGNVVGGLARNGEAGLSGRGVGVAGVEDHGARVPVGHVLARDGHRGGAEAVGGEGARGDAGLVSHDERHVAAIRVAAEARVQAGGAHALRRADAALARDEPEGLGRVVGGGHRNGSEVSHIKVLITC